MTPTPTRQRTRDYRAEYLRRDKEQIKEARTTRASELGFKSYSQYRGSSDKIRKEFQELGRRDAWDYGPPEPESTLWQDLMRADAILKRYSASDRRAAAQNKESLLERTKEGRAVRASLRTALGWKSGPGWGSVYFPVMRTLY